MADNDYGDALPMTPVEDLPERGGRSTNVYRATVRAFWAGEPDRQKIDLRAVGIKGQTLRVGLLKAIEQEGLVGKVTVIISESTQAGYLKKVVG